MWYAMNIFAFSDLNKMESLIPVINKLQAVLTDNYGLIK